ncbi:hypothetical protein [Agrococcus sp. DT81.2]|uniref:hypothetical protein n=1 Tax=Agrococcus sp. DT81.2 TaxID=3393414 RepID=UPI003CE525F5
MDDTSPDPIERLTQIAGMLRDGDALARDELVTIADELVVIAEGLNAQRNPQ